MALPVASSRVSAMVRRLAWTDLADVSPALQAALIAGEDKRFYDHAGVDWPGLAVAAWDSAWRTRRRPPAARRLHADHAARGIARARAAAERSRAAHDGPEAGPDRGGVGARANVDQGADPRGLPQPCVLSRRSRRRSGGGTRTLRQGAVGTRRARVGDPGGTPASPERASRPRRATRLRGGRCNRRRCAVRGDSRQGLDRAGGRLPHAGSLQCRAASCGEALENARRKACDHARRRAAGVRGRHLARSSVGARRARCRGRRHRRARQRLGRCTRLRRQQRRAVARARGRRRDRAAAGGLHVEAVPVRARDRRPRADRGLARRRQPARDRNRARRLRAAELRSRLSRRGQRAHCACELAQRAGRAHGRARRRGAPARRPARPRLRYADRGARPLRRRARARQRRRHAPGARQRVSRARQRRHLERDAIDAAARKSPRRVGCSAPRRASSSPTSSPTAVRAPPPSASTTRFRPACGARPRRARRRTCATTGASASPRATRSAYGWATSRARRCTTCRG